MGQISFHLTLQDYLTALVVIYKKRPPLNKRVAVLKISMLEIVNFL